MFKISFKSCGKEHSEVTTKTGNRVMVVLSGTCKLPEFFKCIPEEIESWMYKNRKAGKFSFNIDKGYTIMAIVAVGHSRCHENDKFDFVLGERLAESRAKMNLYKFFAELSSKLFDYYNVILFGENGVLDSGEGNCLAQDIAKYETLYNREKEHIEELLNANKDV